MLVLSSSTLQVTSCNSVVTEALFGRSATGLPIQRLIPDLAKMLDLLVEEDDVDLVEGLVIPEHSFRRARAMLALREGKTEAAAVFLRPSGVPAIHRDGAEVMIDVQMRIVRNSSLGAGFSETKIEEHQEAEAAAILPPSEVVYALWVTYSRILHAQNHGIGPVTPFASRPGTPPRQPSPVFRESDSEDSRSDSRTTNQVTQAYPQQRRKSQQQSPSQPLQYLQNYPLATL